MHCTFLYCADSKWLPSDDCLFCTRHNESTRLWLEYTLATAIIMCSESLRRGPQGGGGGGGGGEGATNT